MGAGSYGFTGKEEDVEAGLVYFGKRFLSPQLGRWVSPDPLAVHAPGKADLNLYAYVKGAVLKSVDPVGLDDAEQTRINDILDGDLARSSVPDVQALAEDRDQAAASLRSWATPAPTEQESKAIKAYFAEAHAQDAEMAGRGEYTELPTIDDVQSGLDVASLGLDASGAGAAVSWVPDAANAAIYAARGQKAQAAMSMTAMVPFVGAAVYLKRAAGHVDEAAEVAEGAGKLPRFQGPKPAYHVNEAHVPGPKFNPKKEPLPADAAEVYKRAVPDAAEEANNWFGKNADGTIYRFSNANDGTAHFSGSSATKDGIRNITPYARQRLEGN